MNKLITIISSILLVVGTVLSIHLKELYPLLEKRHISSIISNMDIKNLLDQEEIIKFSNKVQDYLIEKDILDYNTKIVIDENIIKDALKIITFRIIQYLKGEDDSYILTSVEIQKLLEKNITLTFKNNLTSFEKVIFNHLLQKYIEENINKIPKTSFVSHYVFSSYVLVIQFLLHSYTYILMIIMIVLSSVIILFIQRKKAFYYYSLCLLFSSFIFLLFKTLSLFLFKSYVLQREFYFYYRKILSMSFVILFFSLLCMMMYLFLERKKIKFRNVEVLSS